MTPSELSSLFHVTLEVTIWLVAVSVFGCGFPLYLPSHLHAPWRLLSIPCFLSALIAGTAADDVALCPSCVEALDMSFAELALRTLRFASFAFPSFVSSSGQPGPGVEANSFS